jgi:excisionase family DNA binding protein
MHIDVAEIQEAPAILKFKEMIGYLRISPGSGYQLINKKGFPAVRFGRAIRVPRDALIKWLETQAGQ